MIEVVAHTYLQMYNNALYTEINNADTNLYDYTGYAFIINGKFYLDNKANGIQEAWDKEKVFNILNK